MFLRLRLFFWQRRRRVLEHREVLAMASYRAAQVQLDRHESNRPGRKRGQVQAIHKLWRVGG